ncbi:MAG: DUF1512 domain-containing protein [Desulfurococcales archaeon]|nr:DUF1512 domain-containing protein [Desulfurococcales archaeon]
MPQALLGETASLPDWISAISQLLFLLLFVMIFLGFNQRFQVYVWKGDIKQKLMIIERIALESREKTREFMIRHKGRNVDEVLKKVMDFFLIEPVSIEPTDIIKRLDHLFSVRRHRFKDIFREAMPEADDITRSKAETAAEISGALNYIVKVIKHILILEEKTRNWILVMQLQMLMPLILRVAESLRRALDDFLKGVPIGDGAGPMVASMLLSNGDSWREIVEDTVVAETTLEDRRVFIVKAKGPGSNVGRPGLATEKLVEGLIAGGAKPSMIITVDAALKLESEETGEVAEGVGAAIGDPGPEKIRFERLASKHGIPLRAVIIKMSQEEAISGMTKKIYEGTRRAYEIVKDLILRETKPGDIVIVAGIGNTVGIM